MWAHVAHGEDASGIVVLVPRGFDIASGGAPTIWMPAVVILARALPMSFESKGQGLGLRVHQVVVGHQQVGLASTRAHAIHGLQTRNLPATPVMPPRLDKTPMA